MWKWLYFCILLFIKWRSLKIFASHILASTKVLWGNNENCCSFGTFIYGYGIFAVHVMSILQEILDNHVAGVSANKVFPSCALLCEYFTDVTLLFSTDLVRKRTAVQNSLHSEGTF